MSERDLDPERVLRALRARLRGAGVPASLRPRILRRAGVVLRVDHSVVEAVLQETPRNLRPEEEEPHLYEVLLEAAVQSDTLDELDLVLRLGGELAVGVDAASHGDRVAKILEVPRPPPAEQGAGGEGFGVLQDLFAGPETPQLGSDHGPSSTCPACGGSVRLTATHSRRESNRGVRSGHDFRCRRCYATGTLERFYSRRLRGNHDQAELGFPGLLGPLASRRWCRRFEIALALVAIVAAALGGPSEELATSSLVLSTRARMPAELGVIFLFGLLLFSLVYWWCGQGAGWAFVGLWSAVVFLHALWAMAAPPIGWQSASPDP